MDMNQLIRDMADQGDEHRDAVRAELYRQALGSPPDPNAELREIVREHTPVETPDA